VNLFVIRDCQAWASHLQSQTVPESVKQGRGQKDDPAQPSEVTAVCYVSTDIVGFVPTQGDLMPTSKRLRALLIVTFGVIMAAMTFAGPASAATNPNYPGTSGTTVLGTTASTGTTASVPIQVAGVTASAPATATSGLAFTGTNAIGIGALGGLLLVGGGAMVFAGRRRKSNA
jgi:hypothetical protein